MLAAEPLVEKSFEIWPGVLRFAAAGENAHAALDAGMDMARELTLNLIADADLIAKMGAAGSLDMLPRGAAGRMVPDAVRALMQANGGASLADVPPPLVALPGAVCDATLAAMREAGGCPVIVVSLDDAAAFHIEGQVEGRTALAATHSAPLMLGEFLRALGPGQGGVALAGLRGHFPTSGAADGVMVHARSAAMAAFAAAFIADGTAAPSAHRKGRLADPLVASAFQGRRLTGEVGALPPDTIREALSGGVKRASALREKALLRACVLALRGRGRTLGPIDGDRLLRFGVSEWR
ncbi:MAG TPA: hypothetical protein PKA57_03905 [Parvibaculum sp.]|uniref:hypothetical protein n=2 Tax=Parvibaculum sp. TaxID=2024848 RepID=UPI002CB7A458|nr:hypothetical protein [Parvibaculum sp.]HMM13747.1 hypothetical protein [Parvibaculum sp.]